MKRDNVRWRRFQCLRLVPVVLIALGLALPAVAQDPWWKRGKDLLGSAGGDVSGLPADELADGLKEALRVGTERVVAQLGKPGGFESDPSVHIPLPANLESVQSVLGGLGLSSMMDDLEAKLNEAAEIATPKAQDLFVDAISDMTLEDARKIYDGADDSATRYFQSKMTAPLAEEMSPVVADSLSEVGAVAQFDAAMAQYRELPFVPDVKSDLTGYVVEKGMDGIFHYLAEQEAAIRANPAARTTELLQKVFGGS